MAGYYIKTFGCQMNENDSEKIAGLLEGMGYQKVPTAENAQIVVLNTCSVRENANDKFFGHLGQLKSLKRDNPEAIIATCGCMMQQEHVVDRIREKHPFVDIVFGTHNIQSFPLLLARCKASRAKAYEVLADGALAEGLPTVRAYRHKAYVTVMNGCDNFCTYCIVPHTRGREKSRSSKDILKEIECLANDGVKEIMLLGQNVDSYGKKPGKEISFAKLLSRAAKVEGIERVRFMTSHPNDFSEDILEAMLMHPNICPNIHLPVQSGSSRILKAMNRRYDREGYIALTKKIRSALKNATISTDIIVAFPGETERDFEDTLETVEECSFESAFTFLFSPREGTKASEMDGQIPKEIANERFSRLTDLLHSIMAQKAQSYVGSIQEVICDDASATDPSLMCGRTANNKLVNFSGVCKQGETVNVRIDRAHTFYLSGESV
ncbi:MAG: tRNA (N6-isopentenyl adenosine(37)-C2)-methylthiotransferase MiaB [Eubacteriaceae bacterium]|jgi:tRNA-2-methylthio-N6-dimethylallyladenosine synthase|nr:tRNA (N6-isopentenyl adenosine(37)-C2)-methylthiotransferase MiaB [Eubacteriaceae bacterium]